MAEPFVKWLKEQGRDSDACLGPHRPQTRNRKCHEKAIGNTRRMEHITMKSYINIGTQTTNKRLSHNCSFLFVLRVSVFSTLSDDVR
jgi:hypothetical protein